jgi:SAM-dependent methyltransferase
MSAEFDRLAVNYYRRELLLGDSLGPWLGETVSAIAKSSVSASRALDLTCGAGRHTVVIAENYDEVSGSDLSPEMIELAREHSQRANITYEVRDLFTLSGEYDLVFSSAAMHDMPDLDQTLEHIKGLVRPGGALIIADVTAKWSPKPWLYYRWSPLYWLPLDLFRRPGVAWELYKLCTERAWVRHLSEDHYLSRPEFERRYSQHFAGATFHEARHLYACVWKRPLSSSAA